MKIFVLHMKVHYRIDLTEAILIIKWQGDLFYFVEWFSVTLLFNTSLLLFYGLGNKMAVIAG